MISKNWKSKFRLVEIQGFPQTITCGNTFGLLFLKVKNQHVLRLIPLNEQLSLHKADWENGFLLQFDRELITEDDVEYALDVLNLFNLTENAELFLDESMHKELKPILELLNREQEKPDGSYLVVKSALKILLLMLIRYQQKYFLNQDLQQNRIYSFLQLMEQNFQKEPTPHFYSEKLGISTKRLNQILKEKLGLTANQIIQQRRLTEIKRELQNNNRTLKEIAFEYSFNSAVSFSRFFKRYAGLTAQNFRRQSGHEAD